MIKKRRERLWSKGYEEIEKVLRTIKFNLLKRAGRVREGGKKQMKDRKEKRILKIFIKDWSVLLYLR